MSKLLRLRIGNHLSIVHNADAATSRTKILVRTFHDRISNPRNAQLVFTPHDSSLLDELTPDEAWIAEAGPQSHTKLTGLAKFKSQSPREPDTHNLADAYRNGRFGGIPNADIASMRLGLDT